MAIGPVTERNSMAYGERPDGRRVPGGARWCRWAGGAKSGRPADVAMMQATNFGDLDDHADFWPLDWPRVGCILVEREVSSGPVIVREVVREDAAQVPVAQDEDVVQTLAPDRADEALREGVLPRAVGWRRDFGDPHALHSLPERVTVDAVAIAEEIGRRAVLRERVDELLGWSRRRWDAR